MKKDQKGFSPLGILAAVIILSLIGLAGLSVWRGRDSASLQDQDYEQKAQEEKAETVNPYADWEQARSERAGFTFKYPKNWKYTNAIGDKDGIEHIELKTENFILRMDTYADLELPGGGQRSAKCIDCKKILNDESIEVGKLGTLQLEIIQYELDTGTGNAIILRQKDETYLIPSPTATGRHTSFRGISALESLQAYQGESSEQFAKNKDFETAKLILKSINY